MAAIIEVGFSLLFGAAQSFILSHKIKQKFAIRPSEPESDVKTLKIDRIAELIRQASQLKTRLLSYK